MSARAARPFLSDIRRIERELPVPVPVRLRILRELEYDLEELRERFLAKGLDAGEASQRARDALLPDALALLELGQVHTPTYRRLAARLGPDRIQILERAALAVVTAVVVWVEAAALVGVDLLSDASPFLWPVMGLGGLLCTAVLGAAFRLWVKRDRAGLDRGPAALLWLAGFTLLVGVAGALVDSIGLATLLERSPELASVEVSLWVVREAALLSAAILVAMAGGLAWLVLGLWHALVRADRLDLLDLPGWASPHALDATGQRSPANP